MAFPLVEVALMDPKSTRGFLNCNPGNMDRGEPPWNGEIRDPARCANDVQRGELVHGRFCVFVDAAHGIRAMVKNLWAYHDRLGCRTIRDYINRWAPPNENNTAGYIARVAASVGRAPDDPVDIHDPRILRAVVEGIISVECAGNPYANDNAIDEGLALAGASA
jgi:hypothetical protein